MKLGSLFDGIGTFPLSGLQFGFTPIWASEIEAFPISVTKHHFPDMKHLGDITKINGAEIEPVDVITFGSPCQDMSVAGKREGLKGERSGLFMEAVRIIRGMRSATNGQYPRFAVWENVPGAFSSNKGQDFRAVLEEIGNAEIPMPKSGRWATAGMVRTPTADIAWRTTDAQHWGVSQRRRRIFLVADFGGTSAGEILFIEQSLRGDSAEGGEAREEIAGAVGNGFAAAGFKSEQSADARGIGWQIETAPTLPSEGATPCICSRINCTPDGITGAVSSKWAKGTGGPADDEHYSLGNYAVCIQGSMIGRADKNGPQGDGVNEEVSFTLNTTDRHAVAYGVDKKGDDEFAKSNERNAREILRNLWGEIGTEAFTEWGLRIFNSLQQEEILQPEMHGGSIQKETEEKEPTLGNGTLPCEKSSSTWRLRDMRETQCKGCSPQGRELEEQRAGEPPTPLSELPQLTTQAEEILFNMWETGEGARILRETLSEVQEMGRPNVGENQPKYTRYAVRRLVPLECERLMGLPDNYTNIEGAKDTNRYKAIGNGIAKPCSDFVLGGIARVMKGATI